MTIPTWLLLDVAIVEAAALAVAWLIILGHGARGMYVRAREPRVADARDAVVRALLTGDLDDSARRRLQALSRAERVRLFNRVAPNLRGKERGWLGTLAEEMGLVAYGRRLTRSRLWWKRLRGARLLTLAGGTGEAVLDLADDANPLIRSQVAEWCGANPSEQSVSTLIRMLGDENQSSRFAVQDALVRVGHDAVVPLEAALREIPIWPDQAHSDRDEKAAMVGLRVARGIGDGRLVDAVVRLSNHPSWQVRQEAFRALGMAGGGPAADRLEEGLEDPHEEVRASAAAALGELEHWPAGPALVKAMGDPEWVVRAAAGRALVRLGPPGELLLRRTMASEDSFAADMAHHALDTAGIVIRFGGA